MPCILSYIIDSIQGFKCPSVQVLPIMPYYAGKILVQYDSHADDTA